MNEIGDKFLLTGDRFMPEMNFTQDLHIVWTIYKKQEKNTKV